MSDDVVSFKDSLDCHDNDGNPGANAGGDKSVNGTVHHVLESENPEKENTHPR